MGLYRSGLIERRFLVMFFRLRVLFGQSVARVAPKKALLSEVNLQQTVNFFQPRTHSDPVYSAIDFCFNRGSSSLQPARLLHARYVLNLWFSPSQVEFHPRALSKRKGAMSFKNLQPSGVGSSCKISV